MKRPYFDKRYHGQPLVLCIFLWVKGFHGLIKAGGLGVEGVFWPDFDRRPDRAGGNPGRHPFVGALAEPGDKGESLAVVRDTQRVQILFIHAFEVTFGRVERGLAGAKGRKGGGGFPRERGKPGRVANGFGAIQRPTFG